jgi:hypothetical protein
VLLYLETIVADGVGWWHGRRVAFLVVIGKSFHYAIVNHVRRFLILVNNACDEKVTTNIQNTPY